MKEHVATIPATRGNRTKVPRGRWLAPTGLILLSLIPVLAGAARLSELAGGAVATEQNARFLDSPVPVVTHIVSVTVFSLPEPSSSFPRCGAPPAAGIVSWAASSSPPDCSRPSPVCGCRSSTRTHPATAHFSWSFG